MPFPSGTSRHKIKLIGPTMMRTFRCVWMLEELGITDFEHDSVARPWSNTAHQYHPMGKVPSLVVNEDFVLTESAAINTFLATLHKRNDLVPDGEDIFARAKYDQTVLMIMSELDAQGLWIHRKHHDLLKVFGDSPKAVEAARGQFDKAHQALSSQLSPYLLGVGFSAADILYVHCIDWAEGIGWWSSNNESDLVAEYVRKCRARPAYQATKGRVAAEKEAHKRKKSGSPKL